MMTRLELIERIEKFGGEFSCKGIVFSLVGEEVDQRKAVKAARDGIHAYLWSHEEKVKGFCLGNSLNIFRINALASFSRDLSDYLGLKVEESEPVESGYPHLKKEYSGLEEWRLKGMVDAYETILKGREFSVGK